MYRQISDIEIQLNRNDILSGQGIDPGRASKQLITSAESIIEEANKLVKPAALYIPVIVNKFKNENILFKGGSFSGPLVARALFGAEQLNIALCTIGSNLENRVADLMNDNPVQALALEGAGIAAIKQVSQIVEDLISETACELEVPLGMRVHPGQEGWPIEQQRQVFQILPAEVIGITLTENCLMIPRKSLSFVIPQGLNLSVSVSPCNFCSKNARCQWKNEQPTD